MKANAIDPVHNACDLAEGVVDAED
jgi:hypothetical protein